MKLFENYLSGIEDILDNSNISSFSRPVNESMRSSDILLKGHKSVRNFSALSSPAQLSDEKVLLNLDKDGLEKLFGLNQSELNEIVIGSHPDFTDIPHNGYTYHHCVSMFVDIKGSTRLGLKHKRLENVRLIKDSLLTLCIHVSHFFGGHIHRLQGDAVFVQFVRKGRYKNDAIINALNAASVLCQFVEKNLSEVFIKKGLQPIKIRVGIDYGKDDEVLWSHYGVPGCAELTTTSLHTDLAAKLQGRASANGIVIGDQMVTELDLPTEYYEGVYRTANGVPQQDRYIINDIAYKQHVFRWDKYLQSYDFIRLSGNDGSLEILEKDFKLVCEIYDGEENNIENYYQNSRSIPKGKNIRYTIYCKGVPYHKQNFEEITWRAFNRGEEAKNVLQHDFNKTYENKSYCVTSAAYLGHHYVQCKIKRSHSENINICFPIYVQ